MMTPVRTAEPPPLAVGSAGVDAATQSPVDPSPSPSASPAVWPEAAAWREAAAAAGCAPAATPVSPPLLPSAEAQWSVEPPQTSPYAGAAQRTAVYAMAAAAADAEAAEAEAEVAEAAAARRWGRPQQTAPSPGGRKKPQRKGQAVRAGLGASPSETMQQATATLAIAHQTVLDSKRDQLSRRTRPPHSRRRRRRRRRGRACRRRRRVGRRRLSGKGGRALA